MLKNNIQNLNIVDSMVSSTNFLKFVEYFENDDVSWIDEINSKLE